MKAFIYSNYDNLVVVKKYLDIIKNGLEQAGYEVEWRYEIKDNKSDLWVFATCLSLIKAYLKGYRKLVLWVQGIEPEESFFKHNSYFRFFILKAIDYFAIKKSDFVFFVSNEMKRHYEHLLKTDLSDKSYLMPCFNEDSFDVESKNYDRYIFAYVGSLSKWQCFEETVSIYKEIEKAIPDSFIKVLTFDPEKAIEILEKYEIKNYKAYSVSQEKVKEELKDVTYGFIIREDIELNRVATPTKFSSYLSAGVLPIYSSCLTDFKDHYEKMNIGFCFDKDRNQIEDIITYVKTKKNKERVNKDIAVIFKNYFSTEKHSGEIARIFSCKNYI